MKVTRDDIGVWYDSARGIYIGEEVINLAEQCGFKPKARRPRRGWSRHEFYWEIVQEAEDFLNDHIAPPGTYFGFHPDGDGCWGLWLIEDEEG